MGLLDFTGEWVVMALCAIDARAVDEWGHSFCDGLVIVLTLVKKPR